MFRGNVSMKASEEPKYTSGSVIVNHQYLSGIGLNFTVKRQEMNHRWEKAEKPVIKSECMWTPGSVSAKRFVGGNFDKDLEGNWGFSQRIPTE